MKVRAIRSFIDRYTMKDIDRGTEFEVTEERFSELTTGPRGVFVEEIKEEKTLLTGQEEKKVTNEESPKEELKKEDKKKSPKK